jgi:hypothetical protein
MTVEQALSRLCILWPHRVNDLTELIQVYSPALADLTPGELGDAVGMAVMECKFFPTPAELRAFAKPKREPEAEFDLIAGARANQAVNSLPQLPPGMTEAQAAARRLDWERLKADTLAAIRAGGDAVKQDRPTASQKLARVVEGYTPPAPNPAADRLLLDVPGRMAQGLAAYEREQALKQAQMAAQDAAYVARMNQEPKNGNHAPLRLLQRDCGPSGTPVGGRE